MKTREELYQDLEKWFNPGEVISVRGLMDMLTEKGYVQIEEPEYKQWVPGENVKCRCKELGEKYLETIKDENPISGHFLGFEDAISRCPIHRRR